MRPKHLDVETDKIIVYNISSVCSNSTEYKTRKDISVSESGMPGTVHRCDSVFCLGEERQRGVQGSPSLRVLHFLELMCQRQNFCLYKKHPGSKQQVETAPDVGEYRVFGSGTKLLLK